MQEVDSAIHLIQETGVVAIIRRRTPFDAPAIARALAIGGVRALEITIDSHDALHAIEAVRKLDFDVEGDVVVGAGTVRSPGDARAALDAGAQFLVAPNFDPATVEVALAAGVPMLPGVATPTEAVAAWQAGCPLLKLFPAAALGATFLRLMRDPLADISFMATGGVDLANLEEFVRAGAVAVGLGSGLVGKGDEAPATIAERAAHYIAAVARARHG